MYYETDLVQIGSNKLQLTIKLDILLRFLDQYFLNSSIFSHKMALNLTLKKKQLTIVQEFLSESRELPWIVAELNFYFFVSIIDPVEKVNIFFIEHLRLNMNIISIV